MSQEGENAPSSRLMLVIGKETIKTAALIKCKAAKMPYKEAKVYLKRYDIELNTPQTYYRWMRAVSELIKKRRAALLTSGLRDSAYNALEEIDLIKETMQGIMLTAKSEMARVAAAKEYRETIVFAEGMRDEIVNVETSQIDALAALRKEKKILQEDAAVENAINKKINTAMQ